MCAYVHAYLISVAFQAQARSCPSMPASCVFSGMLNPSVPVRPHHPSDPSVRSVGSVRLSNPSVRSIRPSDPLRPTRGLGPGPIETIWSPKSEQDIQANNEKVNADC